MRQSDSQASLLPSLPDHSTSMPSLLPNVDLCLRRWRGQTFQHANVRTFRYSFRDFSKKRYFYSTSLPWFFKSSIQQSSIINSFWRIFVPHLPRYFRGSNLRVEYFAYRISLTPQSSPPVYLITCLSMIPSVPFEDFPYPPPASTGNRQTIRLSNYQTIRHTNRLAGMVKFHSKPISQGTHELL